MLLGVWEQASALFLPIPHTKGARSRAFMALHANGGTVQGTEGGLRARRRNAPRGHLNAISLSRPRRGIESRLFFFSSRDQRARRRVPFFPFRKPTCDVSHAILKQRKKEEKKRRRGLLFLFFFLFKPEEQRERASRIKRKQKRKWCKGKFFFFH